MGGGSESSVFGWWSNVLFDTFILGVQRRGPFNSSLLGPKNFSKDLFHQHVQRPIFSNGRLDFQGFIFTFTPSKNPDPSEQDFRLPKIHLGISVLVFGGEDVVWQFWRSNNLQTQGIIAVNLKVLLKWLFWPIFGKLLNKWVERIQPLADFFLRHFPYLFDLFGEDRVSPFLHLFNFESNGCTLFKKSRKRTERKKNPRNQTPKPNLQSCQTLEFVHKFVGERGPFLVHSSHDAGELYPGFLLFQEFLSWKTWRVVFVSHRSINLVREVDCFSRPINREGKKMWESFRHSLFLR